VSGTDAPQRLDLSVGERRVVPLQSLATAGYRWRARVEGDDPGSVEVELRLAALEPTAPLGRSRPEEAVVAAVRPGRAIVRLEQRRPWEAGAPPHATIDLEVDVTGGN
jgi:hypothetical protein